MNKTVYIITSEKTYQNFYNNNKLTHNKGTTAFAINFIRDFAMILRIFSWFSRLTSNELSLADVNTKRFFTTRGGFLLSHFESSINQPLENECFLDIYCIILFSPFVVLFKAEFSISMVMLLLN